MGEWLEAKAGPSPNQTGLKDAVFEGREQALFCAGLAIRFAITYNAWYWNARISSWVHPLKLCCYLSQPLNILKLPNNHTYTLPLLADVLI